MKGIILAGGHGSRLMPMTRAVSKHLLPVYDKPMICYPLSVLIECGIREIAVIIKSMDYQSYNALLGTGAQWGVEFEYYFQNEPRGIADAFLVADKFIGGENVCLILGDNIFTDAQPIVTAADGFAGGATIFSFESDTPEKYGVISFDGEGGVAAIEEKPSKPKSAFVVTGCYLYDKYVVDIAKCLKPSRRGELEITDVNNAYITRRGLKCFPLENPGRRLTRPWRDAGSPEDLLWASMAIRNVDPDIGSPDEAAKRRDERLAHVV